MKLSRFKVNTKSFSFYFHYKRISKDLSNYFAKIIDGGVYKKIKHQHNVQLIIDVGANFGSASIFFSLNYPNATILSMEPVSESYEILELNTKNFQNIVCYKYAVTDTIGTSDIFILRPRTSMAFSIILS